MDALTGSSLLATLVGLICNWKQERGAQDQEKFQSFLLWLENHNFQELRLRIGESEELQRSLSALLRSDMASVTKRLDTVCDAITSVASRLEGLSSVAEVLESKSDTLSDQACAILKWFSMTGCSRFVMFHHPNQKPFPYRLYPTLSGRSIYPKEPQFVEADIAELQSFGFIQLVDYSSRDQHPIYGLTRSGGRFASELPESLVPSTEE